MTPPPFRNGQSMNPIADMRLLALPFVLAGAYVHALPARSVELPARESGAWEDQGDFYYLDGIRVPLLRTRPLPTGPGAPSPSASPDPDAGEVFLEPRSGKRMTVMNRVIVRLKEGTELAPILERSNTRLLEKLKLENAFLLQCEGDPLGTAALIHAEPGVAWAEPEFVGEADPTFIPNDPRFKDQWFLRNTGQFGGRVGADLNTAPAWDITLGRREIKVAIFDEGVPKGHPDINLSPLSRNFIPDPPTDDPSPESSKSTHGVACAGLAGAIGNNSLGGSGVAPNITILAIKVLDWPIQKFASNLGVAKAMLYAAENSDIGSISVGVFGSNTVKDAIRQAVRTGRKGKGYLLFKSSGNDNEDQIHSPGEMEEVISVGSSTDKGFRADYSNWGRAGTKTVDFVTPAAGSGGLWTTDLLGPLGSSTGDFTSDFGGTSAATPLAAGVAALVLSVNPNLTRQEALAIMRKTCNKIGGVAYNNGVHAEYGYGQLNAGAALIEALKTIAVGTTPRRSLPGNPLARVVDVRLSGTSLAYSVLVGEKSRVRIDFVNPGDGSVIPVLDKFLGAGKSGFTFPLKLRTKGMHLLRVRIGDRVESMKVVLI